MVTTGVKWSLQEYSFESGHYRSKACSGIFEDRERNPL